MGRAGAPTFWGGYSGVFLDPDGHPWEVAHNPTWGPLDDGSVHLDGVAPTMARGAVRWAEVAAADAELAAHAIARLQAAPCYLATVRRDGWPRVHPVGMNVRDGDLVVVMYPTSPKRHDLDRNGRFAVHGVAEDNFGGGGEVLVTGTARSRRPNQDDEAKGYVAFDLLVNEVRLVQYVGEDAAPVRRRWAPV